MVVCLGCTCNNYGVLSGHANKYGVPNVLDGVLAALWRRGWQRSYSCVMLGSFRPMCLRRLTPGMPWDVFSVFADPINSLMYCPLLIEIPMPCIIISHLIYTLTGHIVDLFFINQLLVSILYSCCYSCCLVSTHIFCHYHSCLVSTLVSIIPAVTLALSSCHYTIVAVSSG